MQCVEARGGPNVTSWRACVPDIALATQTSLLLLTDGGFFGRHVFIVLVFARKADGVDMVRRMIGVVD